MLIDLTFSESLTAIIGGARRHLSSVYKRRKPAHGCDVNDLDGLMLNIQGAVSELAVAKAFDLFWECNAANCDDLDVGPYGVRSTTRRDGRLILHDSDKDDAPYVFAIVVTLTRVNLVGWIHGSEGKQSRFWSDPRTGRPAYFIPQDSLEPMELLTRRIETTKGNEGY
jgi:hypothetical protein